MRRVPCDPHRKLSSYLGLNIDTAKSRCAALWELCPRLLCHHWQCQCSRSSVGLGGCRNHISSPVISCAIIMPPVPSLAPLLPLPQTQRYSLIQSNEDSYSESWALETLQRNRLLLAPRSTFVQLINLSSPRIVTTGSELGSSLDPCLFQKAPSELVLINVT